MKNKLIDLNNHLFASLERLGDEDIKGEDLKEEVGRASVIASTAKAIIDNANTLLKARQLVADGRLAGGKLPALIEADK